MTYGEWNLDAYTPIYVELRDLVHTAFPPLPAAAQTPAPRPTAETFWGYLRDTLLPSALTGFARDLRTLADEGKAMLLLDGLDEAPQADDPRRREQVKALIAALVNDTSKLRIIVGSRPYAYQVGEWALAGFGHPLLQPCVEPTFWLARYPITYSQFQAFLDADDGFDDPVWWEGLAAPAQERAAPGE